jgi:5-methylcytosine-specific restriction endonuclease McrA
MPEVTPDPKPVSRHRDRRAGRDKLKRDRKCRGCGQIHLNVFRHHIVPKGSQGGDDVDANLIPLCSLCHDDLHHHPGEERIKVRLAVRESLREEELAYVEQKVGLAWLDRFYGKE